jgi:hypothetical protein
MASQNRQAKVLRIGIIQGENPVQERLIKPKESVSVGESPKNTFVIAKGSLPASEFTLFKWSPKGYTLNFTDQMTGKISSGGTVVALKKALEDPSIQKKNGVASLPLDEQDRGKITIDDITVLFQFVSPPPVVPVQQMDFRPRLIEEDDPVFLGFLGLWSALGVILAIWVWRTEPQQYTLDDLPDRFVQIIREPDPVAPVPEVVADVGKAPEKKAETEGQKAMKGAKSDTDKAKAEGQRKSEIIANSALLLKFVGTKGESRGGLVANLWSDEEQGLGGIDQALADAAGATGDASEASTRIGNAGGTGTAELGGITRHGSQDGGDVSGPKVVVKPRVSAGTGDVNASSGDENQVKSTVNRYAGQLLYCYEKVLKVDPTLEGRVEVGWQVSAGVVTGAPYIIANTTSNAELADCVMKKIRRWEFPADVEGDVSWPFAFKPK